jgi:hypothetical protein
VVLLDQNGRVTEKIGNGKHPELWTASYPGLLVERNFGSVVASEGSAADQCTMYTFDREARDRGIPAIERALNGHLWYKLFNKRFRARPLHPSWAHGAGTE